MTTINLSQNKIALVDDEDYEYLSQFKWHAWESRKSGKFYATHSTRDPITHKIDTIRMHRVIMNAPDDKDVDHWDGDGLNNQKSNLRLATGSQNQHNRSKNINNTSGFKGVTYYKNTNKWICRIRLNGKDIHIGYFDDPIMAARAYDQKAIELFGEFAKLNFSNEANDA